MEAPLRIFKKREATGENTVDYWLHILKHSNKKQLKDLMSRNSFKSKEAQTAQNEACKILMER